MIFTELFKFYNDSHASGTAGSQSEIRKLGNFVMHESNVFLQQITDFDYFLIGY